MKKLTALLIAGLVIVLSAVVASADVPAPSNGGFSTAFRVQNLDPSQSGTCYVSFLDATGTESPASFSNTTPIAPGDSLYVFTPTTSGLVAGQYSGVVSCDVSVAAVVNFSDKDSGASHNGTASTDLATVWYAPSIYNNYFSYYTNVIAQNATSSPINITLDIFAPGNTTPVSTATRTNVPAGASVSFDQSTNTSLTANVAYSAKLTGTGNVAAVVNIYGLGGANNQLYSYNLFSAGSNQAFVPVIMNNYFGFNTALTVQNIGNAPTTVTVTYGTGATENATIAAGSSKVFLNFGASAKIPSGTITGARVTTSNAGDKIVATVNESQTGSVYAASYSGAASGSTTVNAPIVMRSYFGFHSSVTCQNISGSNQNITINYSNGTSQTINNVANGNSAVFLQEFNTSLPSGFIGSAKMTSGGAMVCVINQSPKSAPGQDQLYAYDGIRN